jgi:hypothetical protein
MPIEMIKLRREKIMNFAIECPYRRIVYLTYVLAVLQRERERERQRERKRNGSVRLIS